MLRTLAKHETIVMINGPVGQLEAIVSAPTASPKKRWGIICHPHSLHGGTMNNKIVTTLSKVYQELGMTTVRFNFRGVGQSAGQFDQGNGECEDLIAVIDWVQQEDIQREIWLAGFSFGAYVAAAIATKIPLSRLVLVAPPAERFPLTRYTQFTCPWILVQGELDEVVAPQAVYAWAKQCQPQPTILSFPQASHFFHGQLTDLRSRLLETLSSV